MLVFCKGTLLHNLFRKGLESGRRNAVGTIQVHGLKELLRLPWVRFVLQTLGCPTHNTIQHGRLLIIMITGSETTTALKLIMSLKG